jgi:hypothetical protein
MQNANPTATLIVGCSISAEWLGQNMWRSLLLSRELAAGTGSLAIQCKGIAAAAAAAADGIRHLWVSMECGESKAVCMGIGHKATTVWGSLFAYWPQYIAHNNCCRLPILGITRLSMIVPLFKRPS